MLPLEHFAILLTCIQRQLGLKTNFGLLFEWPLKTGFTALQIHLYGHFRGDQRCLPHIEDVVRQRILKSLIQIIIPKCAHRERSGSVVECLTRDRGAAGSSLTGVTALWSLSETHLS